MSAPALCSPTRTGVLTGADADTALAGMGLSEPLLTGACAGGIRTALSLYSPLKPPTAFGSTLWFEIVGGLRAALSAEGWTQMDVLNASRAVSPDGTLSIGAIGGDEATGRPERRPRNARGRGRAFIEEVLADEDHGDIARGRTPRRAVGLIIALSLISVALNWYLPETALSLLINAVGMVLLIVWTFILIAQMRLHRSLEAAGRIAIRMPGWPWLGWVVLAGLAFVAGLMAWSETGRQQLVAMGGLTLIIVVVYFVRQLWSARR